jgi:GR25 family glycosyltransferase involved in LPS biosynthesis
MNIYEYFGKAYFINLTTDDKKKQHFEKQKNHSDFISKKCTRYSAVFGETLDIRIIPQHIISSRAKKDIMSQTQKVYGISLTYGSLACALSHYLIYEECAKNDKPYLIFEDDAILKDNFDNKLQSIVDSAIEYDNNYDIIYLGYNNIPGFKKNIINQHISKPSGLITGLYGYIVSHTGAQKLLDIIFPLEQQIDSSISNNIEHFSLLCATNSMIDVRLDFGSRTQQKTSCNNIHNKNLNTQDDAWLKLFS